MDTKTTSFSGILRYKGNTKHRFLCISSLPPTSLFLGNWTHSARGGCISKVMEIPKGVCFPTFQPDWKSVLKSSNGHGPDLTVNFNLAKSLLVSTSFSDVSKQTDFDSTNRGSFSPKMEKTSINRERKIKILAWKNSRDDLFVEIIPKNTVELIASVKRQDYQYTHYQSTWGK